MSDGITTLKVVILGDSAVGKSSLALRFVTGGFKLNTDSTVGASFITKTIELSHHKIKFNIWDTAGQERYRAIVKMYYNEISIALLIYDISNAGSFSNLERWHSEVKQHVAEDIVVAVIANKADLIDSEVVSLHDAKAYASSIGALYFRTSCKDDYGISDVFRGIADEFISRPVQPVKPRQSVTLDKPSQKKKKKKSCC
jgi:small GTP-binding protein